VNIIFLIRHTFLTTFWAATAFNATAFIESYVFLLLPFFEPCNLGLASPFLPLNVVVIVETEKVNLGVERDPLSDLVGESTLHVIGKVVSQIQVGLDLLVVGDWVGSFVHCFIT
jgi:hypothetical protein